MIRSKTSTEYKGKIMLRVGIVEDNEIDLEKLISYLHSYEETRNVQIEVMEYTNGTALLSQYRSCYDVIFLDIEMPGIDGMQTAEKIREMDEEVILIFITNMAKYAIRGYQVQALDYVLKPVKYESFAMKMDKVIRLAEKKKDQSITIKTGTDTHRLLISHIQYIEVVRHMLIYHTEDGDICSRGVLRDVEAVLEENGFCKCNKCYLVNLRHVRSIKDGMVLVGTNQLQVKRARKKAFAEAVAEYIGDMQSI